MWIDCIKSYTATGLAIIMVVDRLSCCFQLRKELKQGDRTSSFLFFLVVEAITRCLNIKTRFGFIKLSHAQGSSLMNRLPVTYEVGMCTKSSSSLRPHFSKVFNDGHKASVKAGNVMVNFLDENFL